ncbi:MAG TPA: tRNA uridine-5-carboxymethylaminomethyl(34) synthesis GTPase MnmE [Gemmatimonadales bacterium]|nr:tRNA uridine-5-carboxymethylaminomethyl(34) synthesis GTPase MnmE [Gemmatimonadales bacterium]
MLSDVIAALATPAGRSAIAVVRLSGRGAHDVAASVLHPFVVDPPRAARLAYVLHPLTGERIDQALYTAYRAPASYTGEDAVEIATHGGLLVPAETLAALLAAGARQAAPGEFTRRAVANGKMDLLQAEAVADLVDATAPAQRRAALHAWDRGLSRQVAQLREQVIELEALVSYDIDFPEEDSGPVAPERVERALSVLDAALERLLGTAREGERLREGALVVIAGRPNAGKSSLFNALLGVERAIVTEVPGTTRDAIEAPATCDGFPFRLVDTAGLRDDADRIERLGIEVSRRYLAAADLVLYCVEAGTTMGEDERRFLGEIEPRAVVVRTKADAAPDERGRATEGGGDLRVSAHTGAGLVELRERLARAAFTTLAGRADIAPIVTRERQRIALERALAEVRAFGAARRAGLEAVVAATHLRGAVSSLEDLIGVVTRDDVLDRLFSRFCVGK